MEDEECLPENSNLKLYLQDLGFSDIQVKTNTLQNLSNFRFEISNPNSQKADDDSVDEDVISQISVIVSTRMLFEEDISHIEKLLSHFKVVKNGMLKSMFGGIFGVSVVFLGLALYWFIGYYSFFLVSIFYAFKSADYLTKKHFAYSRLKKLTSILESNFMLLKKTVKFIEENRLLETRCVSESNSSEFIEGFSFYNNFKSDFMISINEMIQTLLSSTQKLINTIPLHDYIENTDHYLCNNFNSSFESNDLLKLYEIYLLVQSEFLQRVILSLIPNLRISSKSSFNKLNKILTETCVRLLKIKNKSSKKFKFIFLNGIHSPKPKVDFKIPLESKSVNKYYKELIFNIHESSKTFQQLLLQCRNLEESFSQKKFPVNLEQELLKLQGELSECNKNISDSIILLKKSNHIDKSSSGNEKVEIQREEELKKSDEVTEKIMVGYTDLDPKIEDEIFEAYFSDENRRNLLEGDEWNLEKKLEQKFEKEFSRNVLKELKLKIAEKAEYWKKREKELLKEKGIFTEDECADNENIMQVLQNKLANDENKNNESNPNLLVKCQKKCQSYETYYANDHSDLIDLGSKQLNNAFKTEENNSLNENASSEILDSNKNESSNTPFQKESHFENFSNEENFGNTNQKFLNDINTARAKIFKSSIQVEEELFYTSGEDSSSEE